jgi:hypothetical protein
MRRERPPEIELKGKVFKVEVSFEFFQPYGSFNVDEQEPEKKRGEAHALI